MAKKSYRPKVHTEASLLEAWRLGKAEIPKVMSRSMAVLWMEKFSEGKFFGVTFVKRTTGMLRVMVCRYGVRNRTKGGVLPYDPKAKQLTIVFDTRKDHYRAIPWEGLKSILIRGKNHRIT